MLWIPDVLAILTVYIFGIKLIQVFSAFHNVQDHVFFSNYIHGSPGDWFVLIYVLLLYKNYEDPYLNANSFV